VFIGLNADENRRVVRMNEETMRLLGVNEGDKIEVVSGSQTTSVRCLPVASDSYLIEQDADIDGADVHDRNLLLPATERDAVGAVADDVVTVRRDTSYVAGNSIVPSMFGLLGVFIRRAEGSQYPPSGVRTGADGRHAHAAQRARRVDGAVARTPALPVTFRLRVHGTRVVHRVDAVAPVVRDSRDAVEVERSQKGMWTSLVDQVLVETFGRRYWSGRSPMRKV